MSAKDLQTPRKILLAATQLFSEKGFDRVSIKEIAKVSKTNSALISYYFGGKKELYLEAIKSQTDSLLKIQDEIKNSTLDPLDKIFKYANKLMELQLKEKQHIRLLYSELFNPTGYFDEVVGHKLNQVHDFMFQLANLAMEKGSIRKDLPAENIAYTIDGMLLLFFLAHKQIVAYRKEENDDPRSTLSKNLKYYLETLTTTEVLKK